MLFYLKYVVKKKLCFEIKKLIQREIFLNLRGKTYYNYNSSYEMLLTTKEKLINLYCNYYLKIDFRSNYLYNEIFYNLVPGLERIIQYSIKHVLYIRIKRIKRTV